MVIQHSKHKPRVEKRTNNETLSLQSHPRLSNKRTKPRKGTDWTVPRLLCSCSGSASWKTNRSQYWITQWHTSMYSVLFPWEIPASGIYIFYFVTSSYIPKYIPMLIFLSFNSCLFYFIPFFIHLSLGPGEQQSVPGSVPVDTSVICISISGPLFSHCVVQSLSNVQFFVTPWTAACQTSLSFTISRSLLKLTSVMSSNHLILCHPLLLLPWIFPSIFSQHWGLFQWVSSSHQVAEVLQLQPQHHSFQLIFRIDSFRTDWFDLLTVQGTLKSLLQHHSLKASIQYTQQTLLCTRFNAKYKAYNTEQVKHGPCSQGVRGL